MVIPHVLRVAFLAALIAPGYGCTVASAPEASSTARQPQVIVLQHVDCSVALASVRELTEAGGDGPKLVVVAHESSNSLLLSGPRDVMAEAVDLVAKLDVPRN